MSAIESAIRERDELRAKLSSTERKLHNVSRELKAVAEVLGNISVTTATRVATAPDPAYKRALQAFATSCARYADHAVHVLAENQEHA